MKKITKLLFIVLIIIGIITLPSCKIKLVPDEKEQSGTNNPSKEKDNTKDENSTYVLNNLDIPSFSEITTENVGIAVSALVMQSTVEISCTVNFTFTQRYYSYFGIKGETVSSSQSGLASGIVINEEGYVLTNAHVVCLENAASYPDLVYTSRKIELNYADSDVKFDAEVITYDESLDLAILKMDSSKIENIKYATFFDLTDPRDEAFNSSDAIKLYYGETVYGVGNARGYGISVTRGVVSAPVRIFKESSVDTYAIQTDAAINNGNSGGPLANAYGAIIGINSFKIVADTSEAMGFAIPSYVILGFVDEYNNNSDVDVKYYTTTKRAYDK